MAISFDFSGQCALVTGGATGLGLAIATAFGRAGARIALNDLSLERVDHATAELRQAGIDCRGYAADVRDGQAVRAMVERVTDDFGAPDAAVLNAGIYPNTPLLEITEAEWDRVLDTNLKGAFLTAQAAARAMIAAGKGGQLILLSSGAANAAFRGWAHYCASKAGVAMLARSLALELGERGIRANAILPGYIDVPEGGAHLDEAYKTMAPTANPLGRAGSPDDIAQAALLLASPLAGFVNGALLSVDGGSGAGRLAVWPKTTP
jgi:NAD(P)-dependent dehydrogenase (short-subunit alcohol dehydrogenase family)